jgi:hypothetical protein
LVDLFRRVVTPEEQPEEQNISDVIDSRIDIGI